MAESTPSRAPDVAEPGSALAAGKRTAVSYCRICEPLCGTLVDVDGDTIVAVRGDPDHPSSRGYLCPKGAAMASVVHDPDRVRQPLRGDRRGGFVPVSWDDALTDIADRVRALIDEDGPDAIAYYSGNPAGFGMPGHMWASKFIDTIGSGGSYSAAPQDTSSRWAASHFLYGNTHELPVPDLEHTQFLLCVGANPLVSHGSLISIGRIRDVLHGIVARGGRVVVVDPARTKTAKAFEHVSVKPSTDAYVIAAMINVIFGLGLEEAAIDDTAIGVDELRDAIAWCDPERAAPVTGIPAGEIRDLAISFATASSACAYGRLGVCRGKYPTLTNYLIDVLNVITGNFDRRGGLVLGDGLVDFPAMMAQIGRESYGGSSRVGQLPSVGGRRPWVLAEEILTPGQGQVRGVFLMAGNPVMSTPASGQLRRAFDQLDLLVSLDMYVTESNIGADYILPAPTFYERADVTLSLGGGMTRPWVQYTDAVIAPIGDTREEADVFQDLLGRLGRAPEVDAWGAIAQMLDASPRGRSEGWTFERIKASPHGVELGGDVRVGRARDRISLYTGGTRDRVDLGAQEVLAQFADLRDAPPLADDQLLLIGRRDLRSINSWLHNVRQVRERPAATLHMHPDDASRLRIADGSTVRVSTELDAVDVIVEVTTDVRVGAVSYPHGWGHAGGWSTANAHGGANINEIIPNHVEEKDPLSGMSILDAIPVEVVAVGQ